MSPSEMTTLVGETRFTQGKRPLNYTVERVLCHSPTPPLFAIGLLGEGRYVVVWGDYARLYDSIEAMQEFLNVHEKTLLTYGVGAAA